MPDPIRLTTPPRRSVVYIEHANDGGVRIVAIEGVEDGPVTRETLLKLFRAVAEALEAEAGDAARR